MYQLMPEQIDSFLFRFYVTFSSCDRSVEGDALQGVSTRLSVVYYLTDATINVDSYYKNKSL